jgi:hypothetical protein
MMRQRSLIFLCGLVGALAVGELQPGPPITKCVNYTVVSGDYCSKIAAAFGTDLAHVTLHGKPCPDALNIGDVLLVCPEDAPTPPPAPPAPIPTPPPTPPLPTPKTPPPTPFTGHCTGSSSDLDTAQCGAFIDLFDKTGGTAWTYCTSRTDPCSCVSTGLYSRHISCANNSIVEIGLGGCNLIGEVPKSINNLVDLRRLWIYDNNITSVDAIAGGFNELEDLDVSWNSIKGTIPDAWSTLTKLTSLDIYANKYSGTIPAGIGALTSLTVLTLADNTLSGEVPSSVGNLKLLKILDLEANQFTDDQCRTAKYEVTAGCQVKC